MNRKERMQLIRDAIQFYSLHGWDWLDVVAFLCQTPEARS